MIISLLASRLHPYPPVQFFLQPQSQRAPAGPSSTKPQTLLFALLISTQSTTPASTLEEGGYRRGPNFASPNRDELNVLYLRSCPKQKVVNGYERVGVGILYGGHAKKGFDLATERQVQLV